MTRTIQSVIDTILAQMPIEPLKETVDTIKAGDPEHEVTGIVTTFMATQEVIKKTIDLGANFIISHEPVYYSHEDETDWLKDDPVYQAKRKLIDDNNICIWRFHDHWHRYVPDGIVTGMSKALEWDKYHDRNENRLFHVPPASLPELAAYLKEKLGIRMVRTVGDPAHICKTIAFLVGASGGRNHNRFARRNDVDTLIVGETLEWETSEYFRDAVFQKKDKALIILGHVNSEEAGMVYCTEWLRPLVPGVTVTHVPSTDAFTFR